MYLIDKKTKNAFELQEGAVIGRDPASDIVVDDKSVSRAHAQVEMVDGKVVINDLGSSRGTFVGKEKVESVTLELGMSIAFGGARFEVVQELQSQSFDPRVAPMSQIQFKPADEVWDPFQLQTDYERLRVVYELNRSLGLTRDLETVLRRVLESAFELLSAERGVVQLFEGTGFPRVVAYNLEGPMDGLKMSTTVVDEVVRERKGLIVADAQFHETFSRAASIAVEGVRSVMCVPLIYEEVILGVIQVDSLHATHAFQSSDLALFSTIASQAAVVLSEIIRQQREDQDARMALVGQVAGGLSRELHALLEGIGMGAKAIKQASDTPEVTETVEAMIGALDKASDLLDELLPFHEEHDEATTNLDATLRESMVSFSERAPAELAVKLELDAATGVVTSAAHVTGLVKNLVHNARDAMGGQGTITVRTGTKTWSAAESRPVELSPGTYAFVEVQDDGPGMAPEVKARIFEPFFTTKDRGEGTGLGLSSIDGLVRGQGGCIIVESEIGQGTTFRVYLPTEKSAQSRPQATKTHSAAR